MKKGTVTAICLAGLAVIIAAVLAVLYFAGKLDFKSAVKSVEGIFETGRAAYAWQSEDVTEDDITATVKTVAGNIEIKICDCEAAKALTASPYRFADISVDRAVSGMFVQTGTAEIGDFDYSETGLLPVDGAVGFVVEDGKITGSVVIVCCSELSTASETFLLENCGDEDKASFYEKFGGVPEIEDSVVIVGQVTDGMDKVRKIMRMKTNGYVNGYMLEEPVAITGIDIADGAAG